ncbi:syntaxin-11b.1 [Triplophysa dalaica]|uniref:syntaxin-11b.1 n=1 Tax=Triplophysa dalaica TaxID=1582913 RepID=UPI0024DF46E2|nr:syntaxin-11b.1 [Triplophysa dalaica]
MRDRLDHLQTFSVSSSHVEEMESDSFSNVDLEEDFAQQAVIFDNSEKMEFVLDVAQETRREIQLIRHEVKRLKDQNTRLLSEPTRTTHIKQDANVIVDGIKTRGEDILARLQKMDAEAKNLEEDNGVNSAVARVARTQYASLSNSFRDAMTEYNDAEMSHKENCKLHIQRQMEIVGRDVSGDQIDEMLDNGQWNIFSDNFISEGKTARSALNQIESRHRDLLDLEGRLKSLHDVFLDVAMLVEEQGPMTDYILNNVQKTDAKLDEVLVKLERAKRYDNNNPFKKLFCGCCPCANN